MSAVQEPGALNGRGIEDSVRRWESASERQRRVALAKAQAVRARNRVLKEEIRGVGSTSQARAIAADVVESQVERHGALVVEDLLSAIPGWGPTRVVECCRQAEVDATARLRELTSGGRERLGKLLRSGLRTDG